MRCCRTASFVVLVAIVANAPRLIAPSMGAEKESGGETTIALLGDVSATALLHTIASEFGTPVRKGEGFLAASFNFRARRWKVITPVSTRDLKLSALIAFQADIALLTVDGTLV